jgi:uncharacterized membrane protein
VFLHTLFTLHYAHRFYGGDDDGDGVKGDGLKFPEGVAEPLYWDFLYYSFTIGVASQTADVATTSTAMRKLTLLHSVLSFLFNTTILALAINVGASLLYAALGGARTLAARSRKAQCPALQRRPAADVAGPRAQGG